MNISSESLYADLALRLLFERTLPCQLNDSRWDLFLQLAKKNVVFIRLFERLTTMGIIPSETVSHAVAQERERVRSAIELIGRIGNMCLQNGIPFVMIKAFQHYPDMGTDIDLFILDGSRSVDGLITESLSTTPISLDFATWVAGKTAYQIQGVSFPLEIHHGRMGHLGEHNVYPALMMRNRKQSDIDGINTFVLSSEDQLIVHVIQRIYDHYSFRLSDVILSIRLLREKALNWNYILSTTKQIGIVDGLRCYISYINQIHVSLFQQHLLCPAMEGLSVNREWGGVEFKNGLYRFGTVPVLTRVYAKKVLTELRAQNWESVARLCLLPAAAMVAGFRHAVRVFSNAKKIALTILLG